MATKPATLPRWATSGATITTPPSGNQDVGWTLGEKPPASWMNWLFNLIYQWIQFVDSPAGNGYTPALTIAAGTGIDGASGLVCYTSDTHGIGLVGSAASAANTDTARSYFKNSAGLLTADSGAIALAVYGATGSKGIVVKGSEATQADVTAMLGSWNACMLMTQRTIPAAYYESNAALGTIVAINYGNGYAINANSQGTSPSVAGASTGTGDGVLGSATSGAGGNFSALTGPGLKAAGNSTRAAVQMVAQADPSAPSAGDSWISSTVGNVLSWFNGSVVLRARGLLQSFLTTTTVNKTLSGTLSVYTGSTFTMSANEFVAGTTMEVEFAISGTASGTGTFNLQIIDTTSTVAIWSIVVPSITSGNIWRLRGTLRIFFPSISGTASPISIDGIYHLIQAASFTNNMATPAVLQHEQLGSTNWDTTVAHTLGLAAQINTGYAGTANLNFLSVKVS